MTTKEEWLQQRRAHLTATDMVNILRLTPWSSPWKVWAEKTSVEYDNTVGIAARLGTAMEPTLAALAETELGLGPIDLVGYNLQTHPDNDTWAATIDGWTQEGDIVEFKTHGLTSKPTLTHEWANGLPLAVEVQVRWQLLVTGAPRAHVVALVGGLGLIHRVIEADDEWNYELSIIAALWWKKHIEEGQTPALTIGDPPPAITRLGTSTTHTAANALAGSYRHHREEERKANEKKKLAGLHIRTAMNGADRLVDAAGYTAASIDKRGTLRVPNQ